MNIKITLTGITGWIGSALCEAVSGHEHFRLVNGVSRKAAGTQIKVVSGNEEIEIPIFATLKEALKHQTPDVVIDYTKPDIVKEHVLAAIDNDVNVIIGTSGLTDKDYDEIEEKALHNDVGVIAAGNFSISATLLKFFAKTASQYMPSWEIIDYSSSKKMDAPNGTCRELAYELGRHYTPKMGHPVDETFGDRNSRGALINHNLVHSVRLPSFTSSNEVIFGGEDERLTIRQDAGTSAAPYIHGTLLAAREVLHVKGLVRGLDNFIGMNR